MKGAICYYSSTGNTELACRFIASKIKQVNFEFFNISNGEVPDFKIFDIVGFACPTFYMGLPKIFENFLLSIENQQQKPAFLLNTFGMMQGKTLKIMNRMIVGKGFSVISAYSFNMPESYPPFIAKGWGNEDQPGEKQMNAFKHFISELSSKLDSLEKGKTPEKPKINVGILNSLIPIKSREKVIKEIGGFIIDTSLCTQCGICVNKCPYHAVKLSATPVFDYTECHGCWSCFNHCPQKAIFTKKITGVSQYVLTDKLVEKMKCT